MKTYLHFLTEKKKNNAGGGGVGVCAEKFSPYCNFWEVGLRIFQYHFVLAIERIKILSTVTVRSKR